MGQTRINLRAQIRRSLGHPYVKVELCDDAIDDGIDAARNHWIKWAVGNATHEKYMLILLKGGKWLYDMPSGCVEVVDYHDKFGGGISGGSNINTFNDGGPQTLFSMDNAMYMAGYMSFYGGGSTGGGLNGGYGGMGGSGSHIGGGGGAYSQVTWQLANQMLGDMEHYHVNRYEWTYHRSTNQLELRPLVMCGNSLEVQTNLDGSLDFKEGTVDCSTLSATTTASVFDSPGFVLVRTYMIEGTDLPSYTPPTSGEKIHSIFNISDNYSEALFSESWIIDYATAAAMVVLGRIRRKFANYASMGGQGIAMDGDTLVSEGNEEMARLMETLDTHHAYEGFGIYLG